MITTHHLLLTIRLLFVHHSRTTLLSLRRTTIPTLLYRFLTTLPFPHCSSVPIPLNRFQPNQSERGDPAPTCLLPPTPLPPASRLTVSIPLFRFPHCTSVPAPHTGSMLTETSKDACPTHPHTALNHSPTVFTDHYHAIY